MPTLLMLKLGRYPPPKRSGRATLQKKSETNKELKMRFWEYDEVQVYATIASCFVYALPRTLACSSHACCWGSTEWRMITWRSAYLVVSHLHPLTSEGARGREREIPEDLIHRLAVRSYKECLEPTANYVRTIYRKKKIIPKKYNSLHAFNYDWAILFF